MSDVNVIFPATGSTFVDNDPEAVVSGRRIEWHFFSEHPDAARVGIVFEDPKAEIFNIGGKWQNHFEIDLKDHRATIWAEPPRQGALQTRWKYTVMAWDKPKGGKEISELVLDPEIIIDDP
jgi:hypothetical protein